ncbi:hypothetical protein GM676_17985 [Duganella radicis]|uniref:Uncharacterized protein n=1 Tax=Duganella radicis TaxID=551988 RepID=A0A6L6PK66_9BURK|nr:hypothetical protein [Duganella radicis]
MSSSRRAILMRNLQFTNRGWQDYLEWQSRDKKMLNRASIIIRSPRYFSCLSGLPLSITSRQSPLKLALS